MQDLKALNSREKKEIYKLLDSQFGHTEKFEVIFLRNSKDKIFFLTNDYMDLDVTNLRVNNKAMYFAKIERDGLRMNIEGAQLLKATKNVIDLNKEEAHAWMLGDDIAHKGNEGYVLLRYKKDILGCGILKADNIRNMVAKERRLHSVTE
jgi:NOL1/NOP2/fmu family ribosome biogenesis protein